MTYHIDNQIAEHAKTGFTDRIESNTNNQALLDLFNKSQGTFSNGLISLMAVIEHAKLSENQLTTDLLCEMALTKGNNIKKYRALRNSLIKALSSAALDINEAMAVSH